jgi:hypothetical protein
MRQVITVWTTAAITGSVLRPRPSWFGTPPRGPWVGRWELPAGRFVRIDVLRKCRIRLFENWFRLLTSRAQLIGDRIRIRSAWMGFIRKINNVVGQPAESIDGVDVLTLPLS